MRSNYKDDLLQLEVLSKNISDLIFINDFEKIIELDIERKKIIKKIIKKVERSDVTASRKDSCSREISESSEFEHTLTLLNTDHHVTKSIQGN